MFARVRKWREKFDVDVNQVGANINRRWKEKTFEAKKLSYFCNKFKNIC